MVESSEILCRGRGHFAKQVFLFVTTPSSSILTIFFSDEKNRNMKFRTYLCMLSPPTHSFDAKYILNKFANDCFIALEELAKALGGDRNM